MSWQAIGWAYHQDVHPAGAKFVLVTLANYAGADGYCFPSQKTLAHDTSQSVRAVRTHLAGLEAAGLIRRERRILQDGTRTSDGYWLVGFDGQAAESAAGGKPTGNFRQGKRQQTSTLPAESAEEPIKEPPVNEEEDARRALLRSERAYWHSEWQRLAAAGHHEQAERARREMNDLDRQLRDSPRFA